jgi:hypothetical protein
MRDLTIISSILDEIALEKPLDWESYNYEGMRDVAIQSTLEQYFSLIHNVKMNGELQEIALLSVMSYLVLENTQLWLEITKMKKG